MKRVPTHLRTLVLGALGAAAIAACSIDLPVDNPQDNPFVPAPIGIIQGTATYYGPAPCVKDGHVEGALVLLLFDYDNPPPPAGLATTALNLATVPGDKMFYNYIPSSGPGSASDPKHTEVCGSASGPIVQTTTNWTLSEVLAGRYQIRAFYSQHNTFNPLFDFANLPVAGDIGGAALADPASGNFMQITVGVPTTDTKNHPNGLMIPDTGFLAQNVPVIVGQPFLSSRPYFWIDPTNSRGFGNEAPPAANETGVKWPQADALADDKFVPAFPQDLAITGQQNITEGASVCLGNPDPSCDLFKFAQGSLPQLHLRYGFPTTGAKLGSGILAGDDLGIARHALLKSPLAGGQTPFYGIDPFPLNPAETDITKTTENPAQRFNLTRVFAPTIDPTTGAVGPVAPSILHDNANLEQAEVAELYPLVVLAKLQENADGIPVDPPTPQTDPVVIIQGITLRNDPTTHLGTMKATSQSNLPCGGLTNQDPNACSNADPKKALNQANGLELLPDFTALVRPATLCVRPTPANANPKGILVAPFQKDFNPQNLDTELVNKKRLLQVQANKLSDIQFGCLPPGYYSVNVVYPAGQAWGIPNQTGYCGFGLPKLINGQWTDGPGFESCAYGSPAPDAGSAYSKRPLLVSQQVFLDGGPHTDPTKNKHPLIIQIQPSLRCMSQVDEPAGQDLNHNGRTNEKGVWVNKAADEDVNANGLLDGGEDKNGNKMLDLNIPNACLPTCMDPTGTEKSSTNCIK